MANMTFGTNILPKSNANVTIGNSDNPWTIVSPELTGTPTAPTATQGDSSTAIATTAFVAGEISDKVSAKADDNAVVHLTGMETITGDKNFTNALRLKNSATDPYLHFYGSDLSSVSGGIFLTNAETNDQKYGQSYFQFRQYSPASDGTRTNRYEYYMLPTVAVGLSSNAGYNIYTSKNLASREAASGGSNVSLVTTGEKYTWNGKADKVTGATSGDIATLDGNGNLVDSGYTIATSVPENAVFTDTTYSAGAGLSLSSGTFSVTGMDTSSGSTSKCLTERGTWESFTNNAGTVTGVKINGTTKSPSSGVVDLGTVITDVSGKADNSAVVHIGGSLETITGQKKFENSVRIANGSTSPSMYFHGKDLSSANGIIYLNASETSEQKYGQCYFYFRHYSPNADGTRSDYYENFRLPAVDIGRDSTTGNGAYYILTSKSAVTVPQGGTGATTASGALANLGAVDKSGDTMTGNLEVQKSSGGAMVAAGNTTSGLQAQLLVGAGRKNHGVYSNGYVDSNETFHSGGKWLIYRDADNHIATGGSLYSTDFYSTNYNLESVGSNVAGIKSVFEYSNGTKTVSFTLTHGQHALLGIASGFTSFFNGNGTLYDTGLPSGFTASLSGDTVTITRSSTTNFFIGGIVIGSGS